MTSRRATKRLRELGLDRRSRAATGRVTVKTKRSLGLEGPNVDRANRRRKGFRRPVRATIGKPRFPRAKAAPHPLASDQPKGRPVSHTNFIRRAAKRNRPKAATRAQLLASLREMFGPDVPKSAVSLEKRRRYRLAMGGPL